MKYYVATTTSNGDVFTETETYDQAAAINAARNAWRYLTPKERKEQTVEVREFSSKEFYENDGSCYDPIDWKDYSTITAAVDWFNCDEGAWTHASFDQEALTITIAPIHPNETIDPVTEFEKYLPSCIHYAIDTANNNIYIAKF